MYLPQPARFALTRLRLYSDPMTTAVSGELTATQDQIRSTPATALDAHVRETVAWHFNPETGCPFWLDYASRLGWDPRDRIASFRRSAPLGPFEDEWLRGGPVERWVPKGLAGKPVYVFETGGTTGIPKTRIACDDFRTDYELFSATLPDDKFPEGLELADARAVRAAPAAAVGRAPRAVPRRHLLLRRSRSALGDQADQEGMERSPAGLQGSRASTRRSRSCRPTTTSAACSRRRSCSRRWR